jgi:hypothetical protein
MVDDSRDQSGVAGFLVGIIVLVFAGMGFSLLVDKRFKFSSGRASLEQAMADEGSQLEKVKFRLEAAKQRWAKNVRPLEGQDEQLAEVAGEARDHERRLAGLRERRAKLKEEIVAADEAFREDRDQSRQRARAAATGETLSELKSRNGRTYAAVTISRVTKDGIEIRHSQGISRLRPEDLDDAWQDRFQWHPEEQAKGPEQVPPAEPVKPSPVGTARGEQVSPEVMAERVAAKRLAGLRRDVSEALRFLGKAEAELARARAEAQTDRGRSVPGSLETWAEKLKHLEATSAKFRERYVTARGRLAAASPTDALLLDSPP